MKISACIIGLNEEQNIEDCLLSLAGVADEIIFVDSHSTDKTISLVKQFTKKIFYRKFDNYVAQKNFAASKARFDWILNLDCDERLSPELRDSILALKSSGTDKAGFRFNRLTWYLYRFIRHSGWYPDDKVRLYNRRLAEWQGDKVHEIINTPPEKTGKLTGDLLHYSFRNIDDHLKTIRNYSELAAQAMHARGRRVSLPGVFFRSGWVIVRKFFFELSFLDGTAGIIITYYSAVATFTKYVKLYVLNKQARTAQLNRPQGRVQ
ncbi:glycosyltransferase family 2 protein [Turneriella parva]|uniref:Glycosyl transferase family 2 n=1 Tax=Turneriella parva (strain ATCC BAA-1111 / DSM 21527 / NCTC 11395 / H) TaxID=869212 RepID=I4B0E6_TURPD|nr:glycosyltransferase family 2 protein [Turneriella parva]AFM10753.1 glycosyl transferase family 2 [Turneriella parva DSM 21527]